MYKLIFQLLVQKMVTHHKLTESAIKICKKLNKERDRKKEILEEREIDRKRDRQKE